MTLKFDLISDVHEDINRHFELAKMSFPAQDSTVLVIAGDLCEYRSLVNSKFKTLHEAVHMYDHVIYVAGNHEFYGANYQRTVQQLRDWGAAYSNFHFLHGDTWEVPDSDVAFVGGTLFTNMNGEDANTMQLIRRMMNDFNYITYDDPNLAIESRAWEFMPDMYGNRTIPFGTNARVIRPQDYVVEYKKMMKIFEDECARLKDKKIVLVTHHAMSERSCRPKYFAEYHMNGGYFSRAEDFFNFNPNVKVHVHGHMHDFMHYTLPSGAQVYCNPFGYQMSHDEYRPTYGPIQIEV